MGGYLQLMSYESFEYVRERDERARELVNLGMLVMIGTDMSGYPAIYIYQVVTEDAHERDCE